MEERHERAGGKQPKRTSPWAAAAAPGAASFGLVARSRGGSVIAAWLAVVAVRIDVISDRFNARVGPVPAQVKPAATAASSAIKRSSA